jgi:hypothetical protein
MLRSISGLLGHGIHAVDGEVGRVDEFYFDDKTWDIRYMVALTGNWLSGRKVLIAPSALKAPDWDAKTFPVALTREQVRNSPDIDTEKTVTRRHEEELAKHYAWPLYWGESFYAGGMSGGTIFPPAGKGEEARRQEGAAGKEQEDAYLQSTRDVEGYSLHAVDGPIGHVADYIVDDELWIIRYIVADTGVWLPGRKVLISPSWINNVDWESSEVFVDLSRDAVRSSPEFDPLRPVGETYAQELHGHYGRPLGEEAKRTAGPRGAKR